MAPRKLFLYISFLFALLGPSFGQPTNYLPDRIILKYKADPSGLRSTSEFSHLGSFSRKFKQHSSISFKQKTTNEVDLSLIYELILDSGNSVENALKEIQNNVLFEYAEPVYLNKLFGYTPNDLETDKQYYIDLIGLSNAWAISKGDSTITIGIVDAGWNPEHPELIGKIQYNLADTINGMDDDNDGFIDNYAGWDVANDDNDANEPAEGTIINWSHGTHVSGIAAAQTDNLYGVAGVGFQTKFLPVKIMTSSSEYTVNEYDGIVYAADHGCSIINCSWGGDHPYSQYQQDIINYATFNKGALIVAAAGNEYANTTIYPAAYDYVIAVANTDENDLLHETSNYGDFVDLCAPGTTILSSYGNKFFAYATGTSMSTPIVSGCAALIKAKYPTISPTEITYRLTSTADNIDDLNPFRKGKMGWGRLNIYNALSSNTAASAELEVFPNPTSKKVRIDYYLEDTNNTSITLYNTLGNSIYDISTAGNYEGLNTIYLNIESFQAGVYLVVLRNQNETTVKKLLINK